MKGIIKPCCIEHINRYGEIYANAFSGEPWNDPWKIEDAEIHVKELLQSKQAYGIEYMINNETAGFLLGTSMLFHYGRTFDINDLAVDPKYQGQGIAKALMEKCLSDMKEKEIAGIHLITVSEGFLPEFYKKFGFDIEKRVTLMGMEL